MRLYLTLSYYLVFIYLWMVIGHRYFISEMRGADLPTWKESFKDSAVFLAVIAVLILLVCLPILV